MRCYVEASHCIDKTLDIIENRDLTRKVGILNRNMVTLN